MSEWNDDMTAAPKDGSIILLRNGNHVWPGYWSAGQKTWPWQFWCFWNGKIMENAWRNDETGPTQWQPLPRPD